MTIIKNCKVYFARLKVPNAKYKKTNPTWECQVRTTDPNQLQEWKDLGLRPKLMVYKEGHESEGEPILSDEGKKQYRLNLKKNSKKADGTPADPPTVLDGKLSPIDPDKIGNGSVANIRLFLREYVVEGETRIAPVLMALQFTRLNIFERDFQDEFEIEDTEVIMPPSDDDDMDDDIPFESAPKAGPPKAGPKPPKVRSDADF